MYFKIRDEQFEIDRENSELWTDVLRDTYSDALILKFYLEVCCFERELLGGQWAPKAESVFYISIGKLDDMVGAEVKSLAKDSEKCEDIFYVFEHFPIQESTIKILGRNGNMVHVHWTGTADINWTSPYDTDVPFEIDCELEIKNPKFMMNPEEWRRSAAAVTCTKCGQEMSAQAYYCPGCGRVSPLVQANAQGKTIISIRSGLPWGLGITALGAALCLTPLFPIGIAVGAVGVILLIRYAQGRKMLRQNQPENVSGPACTMCGRPHPEGERYCIYCGAKHRK